MQKDCREVSFRSALGLISIKPGEVTGLPLLIRIPVNTTFQPQGHGHVQSAEQTRALHYHMTDLVRLHVRCLCIFRMF